MSELCVWALALGMLVMTLTPLCCEGSPALRRERGRR